MKFTTELVANDRISISTKDPEVIEQLAADPDAEMVSETGDSTRFELAKDAFELRFPHA